MLLEVAPLTAGPSAPLGPLFPEASAAKTRGAVSLGAPVGVAVPRSSVPGDGRAAGWVLPVLLPQLSPG